MPSGTFLDGDPQRLRRPTTDLNRQGGARQTIEEFDRDGDLAARQQIPAIASGTS
jgi:hypothetical protein